MFENWHHRFEQERGHLLRPPLFAMYGLETVEKNDGHNPGFAKQKSDIPE